MSASKRLESIQTVLTERGVTNVNFCFSWKLAKTPASEVAGDVADFLDAYLKGRSKAVDRIGDSVPESSANAQGD